MGTEHSAVADGFTVTGAFVAVVALVVIAPGCTRWARRARARTGKRDCVRPRSARACAMDLAQDGRMPARP
jgi:hypothetical protein